MGFMVLTCVMVLCAWFFNAHQMRMWCEWIVKKSSILTIFWPFRTHSWPWFSIPRTHMAIYNRGLNKMHQFEEYILTQIWLSKGAPLRSKMWKMWIQIFIHIASASHPAAYAYHPHETHRDVTAMAKPSVNSYCGVIQRYGVMVPMLWC